MAKKRQKNGSAEMRRHVQWMIERGVSLRERAKALNISPSTLANMERVHFQCEPKPSTIRAMELATGLELWPWDEN